MKKQKNLAAPSEQDIIPEDQATRATSGCKKPQEDRELEATAPAEGSTEVKRDTAQLGRQRLLFPKNCKLTYPEKTVWTIKLGIEHKSFQPLLKSGRNRPYITVGSEEAVQVLTTVGYEGQVLELPTEDSRTKVIIFDYPTWLDPEYVLEDPQFVWAARHTERSSQEPSPSSGGRDSGGPNLHKWHWLPLVDQRKCAQNAASAGTRHGAASLTPGADSVDEDTTLHSVERK